MKAWRLRPRLYPRSQPLLVRVERLQDKDGVLLPMSVTLPPVGDERPPQLIDLALQGGGAHGAFTWGVLDRLLEESWLRIEAISGTSAGAMNAAVMADGHTEGGSQGAREALESFWRRVSQAAL